MKTFFCIAVSTVIFLSVVTGQSIRFGLHAGVTSSFMNSKYQNVNEETDGSQKFGVSAGVVADVKLATNLCLTPSLNFTQKGAVYRYTNYVSRGRTYIKLCGAFGKRSLLRTCR